MNMFQYKFKHSSFLFTFDLPKKQKVDFLNL